MPLIEISKTFKADLAHIVETQQLPEDFLCKCRFIHGHTVYIEAKLAGTNCNSTRMVVDYSLLREFKNFIDTYLDHCLILPVTTKFPYEKLLNIYYEFYADRFGKDATWKAFCSKSKLFRYRDTILAKRMGTISLLNTLSTTAEDMAQYLKSILAITLHNIAERYDMKHIYDLAIAINFKETENTSAISEFEVVADILKTFDKED